MYARSGLQVAVSVALSFAAVQARGNEVPTVRGPFAGLPSKPGPHIDRIKALKNNSWLELGPAAADPKWGRARGRSWTSEMPLAPELRGAFLYGEGQHGYAKPDGHYMDDLWFYDVNAHRWICCYPGAPTKTLRLRLNADGFETTADGDLIPVAQQVHGYEMNTYDPVDDRVLLVFHSFHDDQPERLGVYVYDPSTNAWVDQPLPVPEKLGHNRQAKNGFYDPDLNVVFIHSAGDSQDDGTIWVYRYRGAGR